MSRLLLLTFGAAVVLASLFPGGLAAQDLVADPGSLNFAYAAPLSPPPAQRLDLSLDTGGVANYTATVAVQAGDWLHVTPASGQTPDRLSVSADPSGLGPGAHAGMITLSIPGDTLVIPVTFYIRDAASDLVSNPNLLFFSGQPGGPPPPAQLVRVVNARSVRSLFTVVPSGHSWLIVNVTSAYTPATIEVRIDPTGLTAGTRQGTINLFDQQGRLGQTILVTLTIGGPSPLEIRPPSMSFRAPSEIDAPQSKNLSISSISGETVFIETRTNTANGGNWLTVSPSSALTNTVISVTANARGLPIGAYSGSVTITALGRSHTVPVSLTVTGGPGLVVSSNTLQFQAGSGQAPPPQALIVESFSGAPLSFDVAVDGDWLSVTPSSGTTLEALSVRASPAGLVPGVYSGLITLTASGSTFPLTVQVTFTITDVTTIAAAPALLTFTAGAGGPVQTKPVTLTSSGPSLAYTATATPEWLTVSASSGTTAVSLGVSADPAGLAPGQYSGEVTILAPAAGNSPVTVAVLFTVAEPRPAIAAAVHSASMVSSAYAAGTAITLFGDRMGPAEGALLRLDANGRVATELAGVRVLFDEIAGALIYVQERQINVLIPYAVAGRNLVEVVVEYMGERSPPINIQLAEAAPGLFTADSTGQGPGAILNQDGSLNTIGNRAAAGSVVVFFGTGGGPVDPAVPDGQVTGNPSLLGLPVEVWIGGQPATVEYAGDAPGLVTGIIQVNVRIPASLPPGIHAVVLKIGRLRSRPGVTVAVK